MIEPAAPLGKHDEVNHETRAIWLRRIFVAFVWIAVLALAWYFQSGDASGGKGPIERVKQVIQRITGRKPEPKKPPQQAGVLHYQPDAQANSEHILANLEAEAVRRGLRIPCVIAIHFHTPNQPESENIADSLNRIAYKYCKQVLVVRVDVTSASGGAWAGLENVSRTPDVLMTAAKQRACRFQGVWPYLQIEKKVDQILFGLERVDKNWRPEVKGMQRATLPGSVPSSTSNP